MMSRSFLGLAAASFLTITTTTQAAVDGPYLTTTPIPATLTDWSLSLSFPQFNPSLGTLTSVSLSLTGSISTTLTVNNTSLSASSGTAKTEVQFSVGQALGLTDPVIDLFSPTYAYTLAPGGSSSSGLLTKTGSSSDTYTLGSILAAFTGVGNIVLPASTFTQTLLANTGGNTASSQVTDASLTGTVVYNYTAVPEPTSLAIAGLAAAALALRKRRA